MIRPNPIWRSVAILGVAGLVLTACGGGDDGDDTAAEPTGSSSAPAAKGDGELVIGTLLPQQAGGCRAHSANHVAAANDQIRAMAAGDWGATRTAAVSA